jgi:hypothetical protein
MALILSAKISNAGDCGKMYLQDVTSSYDISLNPGGYGAPNLALANVLKTTCNVTIYYADGTTATYSNIPLFPTTNNPGPYILNENYPITPTMIFGAANAPATLPDGLYVFTYIVTDTSGPPAVVYTTTFGGWFDCNAQCCIANLLSKLCSCDDCECTKELKKYSNMLDAARAAIGCNKTKKALSLLLSVQNFCSQNDCSCNC